MKTQYTPMNVSQKCHFPSVSFIRRPNIFGAQNYVAAKMPNMAATPMTKGKWPTTKYVPWRYVSIVGWDRQKPLMPPPTKTHTNPRQNRDGVAKRMRTPTMDPIDTRV